MVDTAFSTRLNHLFEKVYPIGRPAFQDRDVAAALAADGIPLDARAVADLRCGAVQPQPATVAALAKFFRVKPAYFSDDTYAEQVEADIRLLEEMRDSGLRGLEIPVAVGAGATRRHGPIR